MNDAVKKTPKTKTTFFGNLRNELLKNKINHYLTLFQNT